MRDGLTLTERLERVENMLAYAGFGGDEYSGRDGAVTGQRHVNEIFSDRAAGDKVAMHMERAPGTKAVQQTALQEISARVQTATDRVCAISAKIEEIGIRVMGPLPQDSEGLGVSERTSDGTLDFAFTALNWLDQAITRLHHATVRVENV